MQAIRSNVMGTVVGAVLLGAGLTTAWPLAAQQPKRIAIVEINQGLLDKWLVVYAAVAPQLATNEQVPEDKVTAIYAAACKQANLPDIAQCRSLDDYLAVLLGGANEERSRFIDPVTKARQDLAALLADQQIPAKDKADEKANIETFIATLPPQFPLAHLKLMNDNAKRIFDVEAQVEKLLQGGAAPPGAKR